MFVEMDILTYLELAVIIMVIIYMLMYLITFRVPKLTAVPKNVILPGPPDPLNVEEVTGQSSGGMAKFVMTLHEKYGSIVFFTLGTVDLVSIGDPHLFKQHKHEFNRPVELFSRQLDIVGKGSIQVANGERGKMLHTALSRPFSFAECIKYYPTLRKIGENFVTKLEALPKETHIPILENMLILTVKEVTAISFGYDFDDDELARMQIKNYKNAFGEMFYADEQPMAISENERQLGIEGYRQFVKNAMEHRANNKLDDQSHYFVDALLDLGLDESEELDNAVTFFTGAFHTTANLMTWLLYYVGKYPDIQDKLREEFNEVLQDEDVTHENINKLQYMQRVINETLRHSCLAPFAARSSSEDITIAGYKIPANVPVIHCLGRSLIDPQYWDNPDKFDADRFLPENSQNRPSLSFAPFGFAGKRVCPGYRFAYVVVSVLMHLLLKTFRIRLVEGQNIEKVIGFVTKPSSEIWMTIEKL